MTAARRYFEWQYQLVVREVGQRVIEIGCGIGNLTGSLLERGLKVMALDVEQQCVEELRARHGGCADLEAAVLDAQDRSFRDLIRFSADSCVCINVLEHIEDDLSALTNMAAVLPPGGRVILIVPAFQTLFGPIDELLGHYRRYDKRSLKGLCARSGFRVTKLRYLNSVGFFGWWINARILKKTEQSERQIAFFDRYIVPVMSKVEGIVAPPFGQSLLAVLTRV
jgi:SAM-dependent methyltransferase